VELQCEVKTRSAQNPNQGTQYRHYYSVTMTEIGTGANLTAGGTFHGLQNTLITHSGFVQMVMTVQHSDYWVTFVSIL
jgi:hypothetical protein